MPLGAFVAPPACAAEPAGTVLLTKGDAQARAGDGTTRTPRKGAELFTGETIRTQDKS